MAALARIKANCANRNRSLGFLFTMRCSSLSFQAALLLAGVTVLTCAELKDKRQVGTTVVAEEDREPAETGFAEAVQSGSKYFQDIYMARPSPEEVEFGHVRETPDDWEQRFEKINVNSRKHQGKVRWGDKHGGYGEHYWDYNHAGNGFDGDGEESQKEEEYATYEGSEQVPLVAKGRSRRGVLGNADVEFINEKARALVESGLASKHGGNYRREPGRSGKAKRQNAAYRGDIDRKAEELVKFVQENF